MINGLKTPPSLPKLPGVYLFKNAEGDVLYIGKAKSLATRVASYFSAEMRQLEKIQALLDASSSIDHYVTHHESDALLLEEYLVRLYQPPFNILLKEGNPFLYLVVTRAEIPELLIVRTKDLPGTYFGPFVQRSVVRRCHDYLMKTFQLYRCTNKLEHGCLKYHLGICAGTCTGLFDTEAYRTRIHLVEQLLAGDRDAFLATLQSGIERARTSLNFEQARQLHRYEQEFEEIFATIDRNFSPVRYHREATHRAAAAALTSHNLYQAAQAALQKLTHISTPIRTIDCFDISHAQGKQLVGSAVRFTAGIPDRSQFRRFFIRSLTTQNDYAALQEVVTRRYRIKNNLPDLILIDGGKGQLSAVRAVLPNAPIVSLAKREERLFIEPHGEGIPLDSATPVGKLLIALRDYAHHVALSYHTLLKTKEMRHES
jgi:excinuclease ABC subunit C